jgi:hypothetical protein
MPAVVASTEVERPAAEVFAYATDPARPHNTVHLPGWGMLAV